MHRAAIASAPQPAMNFDWRLPYPSRRQPVFARNVVATSQPLATQAGIAMLQRGGNAVDAALATAIALTVVEPCSNGLGSDLFAILWDGRELLGLNASGRAPAAVTPQRYAGRAAMPRARLGHGHDSRRRLGLGRAVAALRRAAVRRPFRAGDPLRARRLRGLAGRRREMGRGRAVCRATSGFAEHFMPRGRAPVAGECFALRAMARDAGEHRGHARRVVLSRRARPSDGRACQGATAAHTRRGLRDAHRRLGRRRSRSTSRRPRCTRSRPTARASPR